MEMLLMNKWVTAPLWGESLVEDHWWIPLMKGQQCGVFTLGPFGLRVLSLPASVCVCLSVCQLLLVRTITRHPFKLGSPNLNQKMQNILLKVPIVLGAD